MARGQKRPDVARARDVWISCRQPFMRNMLTRLAFIDETSLKTNLAKTTGWSPCGACLVDHVPFGHWQTPDQVRGKLFIAALRHDRLDAPRVIGGPINRELFDLCIETQLAPTQHKGEVVILDNLATLRRPKAAAILKDIGAWFPFLPPDSPDLNSVEINRAFTRTSGVHALMFARLKAIRREIDPPDQSLALLIPKDCCPHL
ncbi:MAG: transposase [Rhodobacter sp.]|nr:transposase [Rhodobacter sp.]